MNIYKFTQYDYDSGSDIILLSEKTPEEFKQDSIKVLNILIEIDLNKKINLYNQNVNDNKASFHFGHEFAYRLYDKELIIQFEKLGYQVLKPITTFMVGTDAYPEDDSSIENFLYPHIKDQIVQYNNAETEHYNLEIQKEELESIQLRKDILEYFQAQTNISELYEKNTWTGSEYLIVLNIDTPDDRTVVRPFINKLILDEKAKFEFIPKEVINQINKSKYNKLI